MRCLNWFRLVASQGKKWGLIGEMLNRHEHACMDKYKTIHTLDGAEKKRGTLERIGRVAQSNTDSRFGRRSVHARGVPEAAQPG
jgi:hypothetical protein